MFTKFRTLTLKIFKGKTLALFATILARGSILVSYLFSYIIVLSGMTRALGILIEDMAQTSHLTVVESVTWRDEIICLKEQSKLSL